ncbi:MAG: Trk family potassium uptake protein [Chloroflexi bacterium]|nr:Trk family potassium uptake protein [Chloroflexota bacterium]
MVRKRPATAPEVEVTEERRTVHPSWVLIGLFASLIALGTLLLSLPVSVAEGHQGSFLNALFTAASAATGTGLVVQDTATFWSGTGHIIIFGLFQAGGLAALIGSTIFLLLIARRVTQEERFLLKEVVGVQSGRGILLLIVGITLYALLAEGIGAYFLAARLSASLPAGEAWWQGVFHAASAFNNAGFAMLDAQGGFSDPSVQLTLAGLSLLGGLSFLMIVDLVRGVFRQPLALDTKLVLVATTALLAVGAGVILLSEARNPQTLAPLAWPQKFLSAFFHSATARTAGLSTADLAAFAPGAQLLLVALMFIGGASGSTAGGVKVNTFALLAAVTWSFVRGSRQVTVMGRPVHEEQVYRALAIGFVSMLLVFLVTVLLSVTEGPNLLGQLFEAVSAFSTTGFSLGLTPDLSTAGKLLIIFTMFVGRVGPLTLAFALAQRRRPSREMYVQEAINLG